MTSKSEHDVLSEAESKARSILLESRQAAEKYLFDAHKNAADLLLSQQDAAARLLLGNLGRADDLATLTNSTLRETDEGRREQLRE